MAFGSIDLHFLPSLFSPGAAVALEVLGRSQPALAPLNSAEGARLQALEIPAPATSVRARTRLRIAGRAAVSTEIELYGLRPEGRAALGLRFDGTGVATATQKDLEIAIMSLAMSALSREEEGAFLIGSGLGPVGAGIPHGPLGEQVQEAIALHGDAIELLLLARGTADGLVLPAHLSWREVGPLVEYRR